MTRPGLEDERSFLLRSLEDLDREHEAGDLSDEDHARLRDEYIARAAAALRSDGVSVAPPDRAASGTAAVRGRGRPASPARGAGRTRRALVMAAVGLVIGGAVWALVAHLGSRLPGETVTGSISLSPAEQTARTLAQAETLEGRGDGVGALKLYESVLQQDPNQQVALAEVGWLEYEAGAAAKKPTLLALGQQVERKAESVGPSAFAPHLYLGSMLLAEGHPVEAVTEYRQFLAGRPPRATVQAALPFLQKAYSEAHLSMPALPLGSPAGG